MHQANSSGAEENPYSSPACDLLASQVRLPIRRTEPVVDLWVWLAKLSAAAVLSGMLVVIWGMMAHFIAPTSFIFLYLILGLIASTIVTKLVPLALLAGTSYGWSFRSHRRSSLQIAVIVGGIFFLDHLPLAIVQLFGMGVSNGIQWLAGITGFVIIWLGFVLVQPVNNHRPKWIWKGIASLLACGLIAAVQLPISWFVEPISVATSKILVNVWVLEGHACRTFAIGLMMRLLSRCEHADTNRQHA